MNKQRHLSRPAPDQTVVLVAEDEPTVLDFVCMVLQRAGYFILPARDGEEALEVARTFEGAIHAILTDVKMPRLDGPALVERMLQERPGTPVLFMSGQTDGSPLYGCPFLGKPFPAALLRERMRQLLAQAMSA